MTAASGCAVTVGVSGTSSTPNRGYAKCAVLNNGSRVRVMVRCWAGQDWQYGAWTYVQGGWSTYTCREDTQPYKVDYQVG